MTDFTFDGFAADGASETYGVSETYSVSELACELRDFVAEAYDSVWVTGEVERVHSSQRGHLYFELVEKGDGDRILAKLDAVAWRSTVNRLRHQLLSSGGAIEGGVALRCRGRIDFYPQGGRLQFIVEEVDPLFTLGELERRRRETLAALDAAGLIEHNRRLELPEVPLRLGLVTSESSAAFHDFLSGLTESGYGFQVFFVHAAVQGREAEREVSAALAALGRLDLDAVVLVRGGGSRTDLAAFDSRRIAEAVARSSHPVLTGLGHEIDQSIADLVSHTALKTPTKVAEFLVERVRRADLAVAACEEALVRVARERLRRAMELLRRHERVAHVGHLRVQAAAGTLARIAHAMELLARRRLHEAERRLGRTAGRLAEVAPRLVTRRREVPRQLAERVAAAAAARLRQAGTRLDGLARLGHALAPERLLERGFSVTRDARGAIVRDPRTLEPGETLTTDLAAGRVLSRVEEIRVEET